LPEPRNPPCCGEKVCGAVLLLVMSTLPPQPTSTALDENRYGVDGWAGSSSIDSATLCLVAAHGDGVLVDGLGDRLGDCFGGGCGEAVWVARVVGAGIGVAESVSGRGGVAVAGGLVVAAGRGDAACRWGGRAPGVATVVTGAAAGEVVAATGD
jgi:hypothetical protein